MYKNIEEEIRREYAACHPRELADSEKFKKKGSLDEIQRWVREVVLRWLYMVRAHPRPLNGSSLGSRSASVSPYAKNKIKKHRESTPTLTGDEEKDEEKGDVSPSKKPEISIKKVGDDENVRKRRKLAHNMHEELSKSPEKFKFFGRKNKIWLSNKSIEPWKTKLKTFIFKKYMELRTKELFDMVVEWPESTPAVMDLKSCLDYTKEWGFFQKEASKQFKTRLLHIAAETQAIITIYTSSVKVFRVLDPTDVTLRIVSECIRVYLRERADTIKCIVSYLTEKSSIIEEMRNRGVENRNMGSQIDRYEWEGVDENGGGGINNKNSEDELSDWENADTWEPEPIHNLAEYAKTVIFKKKDDTLGMLVKIFGSRDLFVDEYRRHLGDLFMRRVEEHFDTMNEMEWQEMLTQRFGEECMHFSKIMLTDVDLSRRITKRVQQAVSESSWLPAESCEKFQATVISGHYWPQRIVDMENNLEKVERAVGFMSSYGEGHEMYYSSKEVDPSDPLSNPKEFDKAVKDDNTLLHPPKEVQILMRDFARQYAIQKNPMALVWLPTLGSVDLELELAGESIEITTNPLRASILCHIMEYFEERLPERVDEENDTFMDESENERKEGYLTQNEICNAAKLSANQFLDGINFWTGCGVVKSVDLGDLKIGYRLANREDEELSALNYLRYSDLEQNNMEEAYMSQMALTQEAEMVTRKKEMSQIEQAVLMSASFFSWETLDRIFNIHLPKRGKLPSHLKTNLKISKVQQILDNFVVTGKMQFDKGKYKRVPNKKRWA